MIHTQKQLDLDRFISIEGQEAEIKRLQLAPSGTLLYTVVSGINLDLVEAFLLQSGVKINKKTSGDTSFYYKKI